MIQMIKGGQRVMQKRFNRCVRKDSARMIEEQLRDRDEQRRADDIQEQKNKVEIAYVIAINEYMEYCRRSRSV